ncbi:MAG: malonyl-ACP O-methyltransferase BioC [Candidatus Omnitrophica bacterium]|nr:malonyl-ACP O-methyltransferase BioC [Candidatus Omnitrophota bacterium]
MDKSIITKNFSKNAYTYDSYALIQNNCAEKLLAHINGRKVSSILELGCGTGSYTKLLERRYEDAAITALDISGSMVDVARKKAGDKRVEFVVADGETLPVPGKFDLITSNASFQWFSDLDRTFEALSGRITEGGVFCFSMYGPETFCELKEVLIHHFGERRWLSSSGFPSRDRVESLLKKYFRDYDMTEEKFSVEFPSLRDFLHDIKHSGTRGEGLGDNVFLGKYMMRDMEKTYIEKFGGIIATHHAFFCKAEV